ncbi:hypothetical protein QVD17_17195 [Tagetes erecta]|uniref:Uncharacterized protein n=1 Tax=Tagetes erecta TaxID=13708 RepID=A0AAD8KSM1_TARER|nr:hypothetical protein QVD17_17195 [Tagetes erecta]
MGAMKGDLWQHKEFGVTFRHWITPGNRALFFYVYENHVPVVNKNTTPTPTPTPTPSTPNEPVRVFYWIHILMIKRYTIFLKHSQFFFSSLLRCHLTLITRKRKKTI